MVVPGTSATRSIASVIGTRTVAGKTPGPAVLHDDHVQRQFTAEAPDRLWLTDSVAALLPSRAPHRRGQAVPLRRQGLLRQYFPKGTDLSRWSAEDLEAVAHALNSPPRKTLGWKTPAEVFEEQLRCLQQPGVASTG